MLYGLTINVYKTYSTFRVLGIVLLFLTYPASLQAQKAVKGKLDVTTVNFFTSPPINLDGEWEFYWDKLLDPDQIKFISDKKFETFPKNWNDINGKSFGFATYRLLVKLPDSLPYMTLKIPDFYTSYQLWANGKIIAENGKVAKDKSHYIPEFRPQIVRFPSDTTAVELVLQIANFEHFKGGPRLSMELGNAEVTRRIARMNEGFIFILAGSALICGLFFMNLSFFNSIDWATFYFGAFSLLVSYYIVGRDPYLILSFFPDMPWQLMTRMEHFSFFFGALVFGFFVKNLYPEEINKYIFFPLILISGFFTLVIFCCSVWAYTKYTPFFLYNIIFFIFYIKFVFLKAILRKRAGAVFAMFSVVILFITILYLILDYFNYTTKNDYIYYGGLFLSFFSMTLLIAFRFANFMDIARKKAEFAATAKSQFLSNMSHEIRTPLNSVIGLSELLYESTSEKEKKEFSKSIKKSGETLLAIVNDILDYSKIEANEFSIRNSTVNLRGFINDVVNLNKPLSIEKSIDLMIEIDEDVPEFISVDVVRLQQIINNLINNSLKFTNRGEVKLFISNNNDKNFKGNLMFKVTDSGIGIAEDKIHLLFKRFSQIQSLPASKQGGTGLGLAISKLLVEALGGQIQVKSVENQGSTFTFTIMATVVEQTISKTTLLENFSQIGRSHHFSELNVLLTEDNKLNQVVAVKILKRLGFKRIDIAENGSQAFEKYKGNNYDLIFMDMQMPVLSGLGAAMAIRSNPKIDSKPIIIAMTANVTKEDEKRCLDAGMDAFIFKPITIQRVYEVILNFFPNINI